MERKTVRLKAILSGAYQTANGLMRDDLRKKVLIPEEEPYTALEGFTHHGTGGREQLDPALFNWPEKGNWIEPTVVSGITQEMDLFRHETFGPVAAVIPFDSYEEVIAKANDTQYGLAAYVYTQNLSRAMHTIEALNFGIIGVNDINPTSAAAPFGGMNESGLGREGAREGLSEYLETKLVGFSI